MTGGSGSAERVDLLDNERSVFTNGTYTACAVRGRSGLVHQGQRVRFRHRRGRRRRPQRRAVLPGRAGVREPWLSFPLSGERRSGILPPTFSLSSSNGFELSVPYYFNIAPNRDLTLTPRLISKRGVQTQASFRYLSPTYSGSITGEFLPDDQQTKTNRYALYIQHNQNFGNGFGGYIYYNKVSDNTYPEDLSSSVNQFMNGTQLLYQQEAGLTYNNGPWSVLAREQHWQTLTPSVAPYGREPQLNVKYSEVQRRRLRLRRGSATTRVSRITTADMTEGQRVVFNPYISYSVSRAGLLRHAEGAVALCVVQPAQYRRRRAGRRTPKNFTESIPTLSFDTGLDLRPFGADLRRRITSRRSSRACTTCTRRIRNQEFAPLFDTADSDFGLAEIFTPNTFVGNDRIADANRLTAASPRASSTRQRATNARAS